MFWCELINMTWLQWNSAILVVTFNLKVCSHFFVQECFTFIYLLIAWMILGDVIYIQSWWCVCYQSTTFCSKTSWFITFQQHMHLCLFMTIVSTLGFSLKVFSVSYRKYLWSSNHKFWIKNCYLEYTCNIW